MISTSDKRGGKMHETCLVGTESQIIQSGLDVNKTIKHQWGSLTMGWFKKTNPSCIAFLSQKTLKHFSDKDTHLMLMMN